MEYDLSDEGSEKFYEIYFKKEKEISEKIEEAKEKDFVYRAYEFSKKYEECQKERKDYESQKKEYSETFHSFLNARILLSDLYKGEKSPTPRSPEKREKINGLIKIIGRKKEILEEKYKTNYQRDLREFNKCLESII